MRIQWSPTTSKLLRYAWLLAVSALAVPALAKPKQEAGPAYLLSLSGDNIIDIKLNGNSYRLLVDPDAAGTRVVNPAVARALALKPSMLGFRHSVGPVTVRAESDGVTVGYGFVTKKDRVLWFDRDSTTRADGIVGPSALPYQLVRFTLAPPQAGEKTIILPLEIFGPFGLGGAGARLRLGKDELLVRFTLDRDVNLATAPTGLFLASALDGTLSGETQSTHIRFSVNRPTRRMTLARPLMFGGRAVRDIAVRVSDFGDATLIPDGAARPASQDSDEIIVTARKKQKVKRELVLGRNFLAGCSSLTYDFKNRQIRISCT
jgi:hypothetical protein